MELRIAKKPNTVKRNLDLHARLLEMLQEGKVIEIAASAVKPYTKTGCRLIVQLSTSRTDVMVWTARTCGMAIDLADRYFAGYGMGHLVGQLAERHHNLLSRPTVLPLGKG